MDKGNLKKIIIIPAYNESESLPSLFDQLKTEILDYDILVIDDGSDDGTGEVCNKYGVPVLRLPVNLGIGGAVQAGYMYASENNYDVIVRIDGDGQHPPEEIKAVARPVIEGEADYVFGSRFMQNVSFRSSPMRRFGISFLSLILKLTTGKAYKDVTSGFTACSREVGVIFSNYFPKDYPEPECIMIMHRNRKRIAEVPVTMRKRIAGKSSINISKTGYFMLKVSLAILLASIRKRTDDRKPE